MHAYHNASASKIIFLAICSFFAGYLKFGFNREQDGIAYCEWAPAAQ